MEDIQDTFAANLAMLHYPDGWRTAGLIDATFVRQQCEDYARGEDRSLEHYRWRAFCAILESRDALSNAEIESYVTLATTDEDHAMADSALTRLVSWSGLREEQWEWLSTSPALASPVIQRIITRCRLVREIEGGVMTDDLVQRILANADAHVQRALFKSGKLSYAQLEMVREHGATRAIRNIASNSLSPMGRKRQLPPGVKE